MNFAQVKAAPGQYIQLQAVITEIKHMDGNYGQYALGKAMDGPGYVEDVLFTCKKDMQFPTGLAVNHRCNWAGKFDANTGKMKLFFGSMAQADVAPQGAVPPPQAPIQTPPPAPQQPVHVPVGQDAKGISIERQAAWKSACEVAARRTPMSLDETEAWALRGSQFMTDGMLHPAARTQPSGPNPNYVGDNPAPVGDDDIPF